MNEHDSLKISQSLRQQGMTEVDKVEQANVVILNTCHIREKARHKVLTELGRIRAHKIKSESCGERVIIAVGGCVAQAEGASLVKAVPFVDIIFGTHSYHKLQGMIEKVAEANKDWPQITQQNSSANYLNNKNIKIIDLDINDENKFQVLPNLEIEASSAYLTIQEGCNKFCTYCVVPQTRGKETSRSITSILQEARVMERNGVKEITLLGQNVNAYRYDDGVRTWTFSDLIRSVCEISGVQRVFYTSSHPIDVTIDAIKAHSEFPQLMPFWHLPVQSGSNKVLKAMNRKYSADDYKRIVDLIRKHNPNIAMCSDFIVGFPGETDADFNETLDLIRYVNYAQAFSFKYSPRPKTIASEMPDKIDEKIKNERLQIIQELLRTQQSLFNKNCIGTTLSVLFQKKGKEPDQILGKSQFMQSVVIETKEPELFFNTIRNVKITKSTLCSLNGNIQLD